MDMSELWGGQKRMIFRIVCSALAPLFIGQDLKLLQCVQSIISEFFFCAPYVMPLDTIIVTAKIQRSYDYDTSTGLINNVLN